MGRIYVPNLTMGCCAAAGCLAVWRGMVVSLPGRTESSGGGKVSGLALPRRSKWL